MYNGKAVKLSKLDSGIAELVLDLDNASVNKLNAETLSDLGKAVTLLHSADGIKGLLVSSAKSVFVVGADIMEFPEVLKKQETEIRAWMSGAIEMLNQFEDLPFPTVTAINGMALGGGLELALATDFRVMSDTAKVGLPEVTLGICPGFGGTVRLGRIAGLDTALAWAVTGKPQSASAALDAGAVDRVASPDKLRTEALALLDEAIAGKLDHLEHRARKKSTLDPVSPEDAARYRERFARNLDPNYPAAGAILDLILGHASIPVEQAFSREADTFLKLGNGPEAKSLIGLFISDQLLKSKSKACAKRAGEIKQSAVLGAGIMGGGIALQSAAAGIPVLMKDIHEDALDLGCTTASDILDKQVKKGKLDEQGKAKVMAAIKPTLEYDGFDRVDYLVEAVVENTRIKKTVLAEAEKKLSAHAVLTTNTSTISIDTLAEDLERPEQFCGMHFFNPVHMMPLVEVIRGAKSSEKAVATAVSFATAMGKTPIVVNNCPGFLVNRTIFPYFNGFNRLLKDGVDFQRIDRVMESFGWPMGPAYLADVVGLDTVVHADNVMQEGFPDRMLHDGETIPGRLVENGMLGQKSGEGFYSYGKDEKGRIVKKPSEKAIALIAELATGAIDISDAEIVDRMMIPMCTESVRCLEDGIVDTAAEVDMGMILGLGFPRFRGGPLRYIDALGLKAFADKVQANSGHGGLYTLTEGFQKRLSEGKTFY